MDVGQWLLEIVVAPKNAKYPWHQEIVSYVEAKAKKGAQRPVMEAKVLK